MGIKHVAPLTFEHRYATGDHVILISKDPRETGVINLSVKRCWEENGVDRHFVCASHVAAGRDETLAMVGQRLITTTFALCPSLREDLRIDEFTASLHYWLSFHLFC